MTAPLRRRIGTRAAGAAFVSLALCTACESPLETGRTGSLVIAPVLETGSAAGALLLTVDSVQVSAWRGAARIASRSRRMTPSQNTISLSLSIPLLGQLDTVRVDLILLAGGSQLFHGSAPVVVRQGVSSAPASIPLAYVGADTVVAQVAIVPADTFVTVGGSLQFTAAAYDANLQPVNAFYATWSTAAAGSVAPQGMSLTRSGRLVAPSNRSQAYVKVVSGNGGRDSALITFNPPVAAVTVSPGLATLAVGHSQQLAATTLDAGGAGFPGATVTWSTTSSSVATVSNTGVVTAVGPGTVTITATSEGKAGAAAVTSKAFTVLTKGVSQPVPVLVAGDAEYYTIVVPAGRIHLRAGVTPALTGGSGDPNISVYTSTTLTTPACVAIAVGADQCDITSPVAGGYAIRLDAATAVTGFEVLATDFGPLRVQSVTEGWDHSCGLSSAGTAYCWGYNDYGQVGDGTIIGRLTPVPVSGGLTFTSLSAGALHTCGLTAGGAAYCWGENSLGTLGDGTTTDRHAPVPVTGGHSFTSLSSGTYHTCGVTVSSVAYCWGDNPAGELGDSTQTNRSAPVPVAGGLTFTAVAAGETHSCGLATGGLAYCWGDNIVGQLGDSSGITRLSPVPVAGSGTFTALNTGRAHTCGLTSLGAALCWGDNQVGGLGDGTTTNRFAPVPVTGGLTFTSITTGGSHTCGLTIGGSAQCWGWNYYGQLGDGATTDRLAPAPVLGGLSFTQLAVGAMHSCAVAVGGTAYCWGYNELGEVGDGTTTTPATPGARASPGPVLYP